VSDSDSDSGTAKKPVAKKAVTPPQKPAAKRAVATKPAVLSDSDSGSDILQKLVAQKAGVKKTAVPESDSDRDLPKKPVAKKAATPEQKPAAKKAVVKKTGVLFDSESDSDTPVKPIAKEAATPVPTAVFSEWNHIVQDPKVGTKRFVNFCITSLPALSNAPTPQDHNYTHEMLHWDDFNFRSAGLQPPVAPPQPMAAVTGFPLVEVAPFVSPALRERSGIAPAAARTATKPVKKSAFDSESDSSTPERPIANKVRTPKHKPAAKKSSFDSESD
jgi:hypothetical protein